MTYVNIDIDIDDVIESLGPDAARRVCMGLISDGYGPSKSDSALHGGIKITDQLSDPVILLETIVWLRKNGYTVEPKEELVSDGKE